MAKTLRELAESLGIDADEIDRAQEAGTLGLLIVANIVVPEQGLYTQSEMLELSGLGQDARRYWRALGFPDPDPDARTFTDVDLDMLRMLDSMIRMELLEPEIALQLARVIGSAMERVAQSQIDAIEARIDADPIGLDDEEPAVQRAGMLLPTVPRVLEYAWRRHIQSAARRRMVRDHLGEDGQAAVAVGFADLVGFTALSQQLDDHQLAAVVDTFEVTAYDVIATHGGRVVKMIGDEVMYEVADPAAAVEIGLDLADAFHDDEAISDVRVGIALGPVLAREGDLFGPTVNLAARLVAIAYAGAVVVSSETRDAIGDDERFAFKALRPRPLKNIGRVQLHSARRAGEANETMTERARRRRGELRARVAGLVDKVSAAVGEEEEE